MNQAVTYAFNHDNNLFESDVAKMFSDLTLKRVFVVLDIDLRSYLMIKDYRMEIII